MRAGGQKLQEVAQRHEAHRQVPPPVPGLLCGAGLGSRVVGRGRLERLAWADSSSHHALGSEVQGGQLCCQEPLEALWAVHGKGQKTEEQGEAGQAQGGGQGKEGPVLDLAVPEQKQQEQ